MDERVSVEQLITGSFVKYKRLNELISTSYAGSGCEEINLFIDINSVLKQMYSIDAWGYRYSAPYEITATLLNMCGHYRAFFRGLGVTTNIYLIRGENCPTSNETFVNNYNFKYIQALMKKPDTTAFINNNLLALSVLVQFIPRIYFFDIGGCETASMIDYIIRYTKAQERNIENIVITKDILALELVPYTNARIIHPRKNKGIDESFIVDNNNLWYHFCTSYRKINDLSTANLCTSYLPNILAMTRVPERNIPSIFGIPKAIKCITTAVEKGFLEPNRFYSQSGISTALEVMDIPHNPTEMDMRYKAIDIRYQSMYILPMESPGVKTLRLVDLEDVNSLKNIMSKYFDKIPIDLDKL